MNDIRTIITGTGSYIPTRKILNKDFLKNEFYDADGNKFESSTEEIINKFEAITDIRERRYVNDDLVTSDIAFYAAEEAIKSAEIDKETIDYIIVAHNFGDVKENNRRSDFVPSIAARVKFKLGIENPGTISYDLPFGCPGWLRGMIQADYYIKSGDAKRILVIGAETLSRISDPHDRDSMLYADGAGATILEARKTKKNLGVLSHASRSDTIKHAYMLWMGKSNNPNYNGGELFLKMNGRKLYEYALNTVPLVVKESLEKAKLLLNDVSKVLIHQANAKLDEGILKYLYRLYGVKKGTENIMPMIISELGNSSVATVPTLLDLIFKNKLKNHKLGKNSVLVFASVGAGMNINSMVYRMP